MRAITRSDEEQALTVKCPECGSVPGYRCASLNPAAFRHADEDYFLDWPHQQRIDKAKELESGN